MHINKTQKMVYDIEALARKYYGFSVGIVTLYKSLTGNEITKGMVSA
jgi:hypothetical protein